MVNLGPDEGLLRESLSSGYDTTANFIRETFAVIPGSIQAPRQNQNFFEFPYDWRHSNRESARALKTFLDEQLYRWRQSSQWKGAKVILLAHSMGG